MLEVTVRGAESLARVAGAVRSVRPELRKSLLSRIRTGAKPTIAEIRDEAASTLPGRGGLAGQVAGASFVIRTVTAGNRAGVRIVGTWPGHDIEAIEDGQLRHPVFGRRQSWVSQSVRPGFFSRPAEADRPELQQAVVQATEDVAQMIQRKASS